METGEVETSDHFETSTLFLNTVLFHLICSQYPAVYTIAGSAPDWISATIRCLGDEDCCPYGAFSDGVLSAAEVCDDGNEDSGDGCFCGQMEAGYQCDGSSPSRCVVCGAPIEDDASCADRQDMCPGWAARGECTINAVYMSQYCRTSCAIGGCHQQLPSQAGVATYLFLQLQDDGQVEEDFSWKVWERNNLAVRNEGTGSGYMICANSDTVYNLEVIANRWNSSAGFNIMSGSSRTQLVMHQGPFFGRSQTVRYLCSQCSYVLGSG